MFTSISAGEGPVTQCARLPVGVVLGEPTLGWTQPGSLPPAIRKV